MPYYISCVNDDIYNVWLIYTGRFDVLEFVIMAKKEKYHDITEDAFTFIKYRCGYCGKMMKANENFCSMDCKVLYFEKLNKIKTKTWISKKKQDKHHIRVSDILNEEELKAIVKDVEKNIDTRMNKSRR